MRDAGRWFYLGCAVLPLAFSEGWGNTYTEPKLAVLCVIALGCLASVAAQAQAGPIRVSAFAIGTAALLLLRLASAGAAQNPGTFLQAVTLDACAIAVAVFVASSDVKVERLAGWLIPTTALVLAGALAMILFRKSAVSMASPFGSTIGWKNSLSVFLAQLVPLLLVLLHRERRTPRVAGLLALLSILFWVVAASRTRSAWWMVALSVAGVALFALRLRDRAWWRTLGGLGCALLAGVVLLFAVLNELRWRGDSPYLRSLSTMASLAHSNGRVELWRVGLAIVADEPLLGIGTGNYPVLWRDHIAHTDVDAKTFGFLRADLPVFDDYLQDAIENGLPGGLLSLAVRLGLPLFYLWRLWKRRDPRLAAETLLAIGCITLSLDALLDNPFGRPETLFVFGASLAFVARGIGDEGPLRSRELRPSVAWASAGALAVLLAGVLGCMSVGLTGKKVWFENRSVAALRIGLRFWPWDPQWKLEHLHAFARAGDTGAMERFAAVRMRAWPSDPESHLIAAVLLEKNGDYLAATERFRRAVVTVPNGRCYLPGYQAYLAMVEQPDYPADAPALGPEAAPCVQIFLRERQKSLR